jgi:hypothetical protein
MDWLVFNANFSNISAISWRINKQYKYSLHSFLYTFNIHLYMHIFRRIFLNNYWWQESDSWSQASYRYAILWETFLDPSDSFGVKDNITKQDELWANAHLWYPLFGKQEVGIWWVQKRFPRYGVLLWSLWPNIRSLPSIVAEKNISWEAFFDPSDSYFLFAEEQGYHKWALAYSSSC